MFAEDLVSPISSPQQQISAILATREFLQRLSRCRETQHVPRYVRREALALFRHFPPVDRLRPVLEQAFLVPGAKEVDPLVERFGLM